MYLVIIHASCYPEISNKRSLLAAFQGYSFKFFHGGPISDLRGKPACVVEVKGPCFSDEKKCLCFAKWLANNLIASKSCLPRLEIYFAKDGRYYLFEEGKLVEAEA